MQAIASHTEVDSQLSIFPHGYLLPKAHFFVLLASLPVVGLPPPLELQDVIWNQSLICREKERLKKGVTSWRREGKWNAHSKNRRKGRSLPCWGPAHGSPVVMPFEWFAPKYRFRTDRLMKANSNIGKQCKQLYASKKRCLLPMTYFRSKFVKASGALYFLVGPTCFPWQIEKEDWVSRNYI